MSTIQIGVMAYPRDPTVLARTVETLADLDRRLQLDYEIPSLIRPVILNEKSRWVELLERATIEDRFLAPAFRSIGYYDDGPDDSQIDYSELGVSHLGSIYEGLISLRLSWTGENLTYYKKGKTERYQPARSDSDTVAVPANELFFQSETGGRKASGVYYTRQEFVRHILNHSLVGAVGADHGCSMDDEVLASEGVEDVPRVAEIKLEVFESGRKRLSGLR